MAGEQGKVRTGPTAGLQLHRLPVRPEGGQGQTNRGTLADLDRQDQINTVGSDLPGPKIHVPHRSTHSNRKTSPLRATTHETHTVALEKQLEGPRITRIGDPFSQIPPPSSKVVAGGRQCATRSTITPSKTCSANIYRHVKRRVGRSLRRAHCKGNLVPTREQVIHKPLGAESSISSSKGVSNPRLQQNTTVVVYINKEGGMKSGSLCALLWRILSWCTRQQVTLRARHIPGQLNVIADKLSRLGQTIQTEWSLHPEVFQAVCSRWHQPQVDLFATRFNNKLPQFVSPVPDPQAWAVDALSLSWEDLDPYAFPPAAILGKVVEKLQDYPCNRIILIAPGWPNMPWFWDLVAMSSQIPLCLPSIPNLVFQPFNQVLHRNLSNLNLHAWLLEPQQSRSKASLRLWQHELRLLKEDQPDLSMRQSGPFLKWCLSNQVDFRAPPLKAIADFLLHLFQDKKLQPGTIDGYRSAIADKLGNSTINVSKDENLTRLLDSFHRDRPKGRRGIPSWNLSLVLHQLTKTPFEPLKEASLKHITFKTVFLLALGSDKRRSEIHAWLHKNIRHQSDWSKVSLYPSPSFLSKNQLAKEGPDSVAPVVIPALAPSLDRSLKGDRSLCPVRALCYYLDRTADLRQNKELVFVSFKKGFDKDISPATISSWIKQTVILCYELSDQEALTLHQVKAHDVRAFAASKTFQSGISLDQILSACHWKSHNTFTQFYLKNVAWADSELFHLGPVVAAQQVHHQAQK